MNIQEITSRDNQQIKLAASLHQKKTRKELELFIIEGLTLVEEAIKKSVQIKQIFFINEEDLKNFEINNEVELFKIDSELMSKISTTENPPPVLAIAKYLEIPEAKLATNNLLLYGENIKDPGNLGSIIRTAFAAGVKNIYLSPNSVDIYNPKVIRSSMGAIFYGHIQYIELEELEKDLKAKSAEMGASLELIGTTPHTDSHYTDVQLNPLKNILLIIGNESEGMSQEAESACTRLVSIPLENGIESINVLAATSILVFSLSEKLKTKS
jgi:RNA methyltransferase, TrmH family